MGKWKGRSSGLSLRDNGVPPRLRPSGRHHRPLVPLAQGTSPRVGSKIGRVRGDLLPKLQFQNLFQRRGVFSTFGGTKSSNRDQVLVLLTFGHMGSGQFRLNVYSTSKSRKRSRRVKCLTGLRFDWDVVLNLRSRTHQFCLLSSYKK